MTEKRSYPPWFLAAALALCLVLGTTGPAALPAQERAGGDKAKADKGDKAKEGGEKAEERNRPSLSRLVKLNEGRLFGGKVSIEKDRFTVSFLEDGLFGRGFDCQGKKGLGVISNKKEVKHVGVKKQLIEGHEGKFSVLGHGTGQAISRFELEDDFKISFKLRISSLARKSRFTWQINREGKRCIQLNFFQSVLVRGGKRRQAVTKDPRFRGYPVDWFDRKRKSVPVEIAFKDGDLSVRVHTDAEKPEAKKGRRGSRRDKARGGKRGGKDEKKDKKDEEKKGEMAEVVSLSGVDQPRGGKLALMFSDISFLVSDLKIEGKLPRRWLEEQIDSLDNAQKLRLDEPAGDGDKAGEKDKPKPKKKKDKKGPDLDKRDPEAEEDL